MLLAQSPDRIVRPPLHLRIRPLDGIQLDGIGILARRHARNGTAAHPDPIIIPPQQHHFIARRRLVLERIHLLPIPDPPGQHNHLVEPIGLPILLVFKGIDRPGNQRLPELVPEVRRSVGSLDEDILRRLVEPRPRRNPSFPTPPLRIVPQPRVSGHITSRPGHRESPLSPGNPVANLTSRPRRSPVERFHRGRKIMGLGLDRYHALEILSLEIVRPLVRSRRKLFDHRSLKKSTVILISTHHPPRIRGRGLLDELK